MTSSRPPEATVETLWQWLTETEDKLEEAVTSNHTLHAKIARLERKDLVKEILITNLRRSLQAEEHMAKDLSEQLAGMEILLLTSKATLSRMYGELDKINKTRITTPVATSTSSNNDVLHASEILLAAAATREARLLTELMRLRASSTPPQPQPPPSPQPPPQPTDVLKRLEEETNLSNERRIAIEEWVVAYGELEAQVKQLEARLAAHSQTTTTPDPVSIPMKSLQSSMVTSVINTPPQPPLPTSPSSVFLARARKMLSLL